MADQHEDMKVSNGMNDLTISVSVAECDIFVLLFKLHLHCFATAVECKQAPHPGSAKRGGKGT